MRKGTAAIVMKSNTNTVKHTIADVILFGFTPGKGKMKAPTFYLHVETITGVVQ